jgi:hypothetical protein
MSYATTTASTSQSTALHCLLNSATGDSTEFASARCSRALSSPLHPCPPVSTFLVLAFLSMFVLMMVIAYLALWVPMTAQRPITDLGAYAPTVTPIGAAAGVATFVLSVQNTCILGVGVTSSLGHLVSQFGCTEF